MLNSRNVRVSVSVSILKCAFLRPPLWDTGHLDTGHWHTVMLEHQDTGKLGLGTLGH